MKRNKFLSRGFILTVLLILIGIGVLIRLDMKEEQSRDQKFKLISNDKIVPVDYDQLDYGDVIQAVIYGIFGVAGTYIGFQKTVNKEKVRQGVIDYEEGGSV